ncbi:MAG: preprotein translocase subunit SecG [Luminiphilus sp.]|jgi:preprotein translocase subunit SecG|nr:preprotein translocase subunit SecG [Luminiphilus sp.]
MEQITLMVHLLVALALIALILLQRGKGTDIGASFGAGASQTLFGSAGSGNALTRMTAWLSAIFFASSFGLAVIADNRTAGEEDLGFEVPVVEAAPAETNESDVPVIEFEPAGDLPFDDAPVLDGE